MDFVLQGSAATAPAVNHASIGFPKCVNIIQSLGFSSSSKLSPRSPIIADSSRERDCFPFTSADRVSLRILVAEDNPLNAKVMKMQLTKIGHEVTVVSDGQACLDRFKIILPTSV
jgi:PleD family two-component response regulator